MFKQLIEAYNNFIQGIYRPELIALNSKEWEWMQTIYTPIVRIGGVAHQEWLALPKWTMFKYALVVFSIFIPIGEVWMWRLEPDIEFRTYLLVGNGKVIPGHKLIIKITDCAIIVNRPETINYYLNSV